jgi:hypothetical protein
MGIFKRRAPDALEAPVTTNPIVAQIDASVEQFRDGELDRAEYRQLLRENDRSAKDALARAQGAPKTGYKFAKKP